MRRGFTLIEILLALALLAVVITLIQGTYSGTVKSRERSGAESRQLHTAALVLDRLANEISGAYVDPARPDATGLVLAVDGDGHSVLAFTARLQPIPTIRPGGGSEVSYFVEAEDDRVRLVRRESPDLDGNLEEGGAPYPVVDDLVRFQVQCFDGEQWVEEWDSREREDGPVLPRAVSVELAWGPDEEHQRVVRTEAAVYLWEREAAER